MLTPSSPTRPRSGGSAGSLSPLLPRKINQQGRGSGPHPSGQVPGLPAPRSSAPGRPGRGRRRRGAPGYVMVSPRRRRRSGSRAAVGVCAGGGRGLGVASARAPRAPGHCLGLGRRAPARLLAVLPGSRSSHSARRPACPLLPAPSRPLSRSPPA